MEIHICVYPPLGIVLFRAGVTFPPPVIKKYMAGPRSGMTSTKEMRIFIKRNSSFCQSFIKRKALTISDRIMADRIAIGELILFFDVLKQKTSPPLLFSMIKLDIIAYPLTLESTFFYT